MNLFGKTLILLGVLLTGVGFILLAIEKIPGIGKIPGDFYFRKGNFTFYFPLATCLILSVLLTLLFNLFGKNK